MRTLIISDLHHHVKNADYWLQTQEYNRVIFLGDFFDDFGDNVSDARGTARWLRDRMDSSDDVFLLGNHDAAYLSPDNPQLYCPGFTKPKSSGIREILQPKHWRRFQLAHAEQGWLMSHAGFHPALIQRPTVKRILARCEKAMEHARKQIVDPLLGAGHDRGGNQRLGGPLWMDWDSLEPIAGIHQIVGHTPGKAAREKITPKSRNHCLDVGNGLAAAILTDGQIEVLERSSTPCLPRRAGSGRRGG